MTIRQLRQQESSSSSSFSRIQSNDSCTESPLASESAAEEIRISQQYTKKRMDNVRFEHAIQNEENIDRYGTNEVTPDEEEALAESETKQLKIFAASVLWEAQMEEQRTRMDQQQQQQQQGVGVGGSDGGSGIGAKVESMIDRFYRCGCCNQSRQIGQMFILREQRDGSPIFMVGPFWPMCAFVTVPLIVVLSGLVSYFIAFHDGGFLPRWFLCIYYGLVAITLISLFFVSCRNPGLIERETNEEATQRGWIWNEQAGSYRPPDAKYCTSSKVLVEGYDHVCPWTGTAIGKQNMRAFQIFVSCVCLLMMSSAILVSSYRAQML